MYSGQSAINYLANEIGKDDPNASSHWQKYHSAFKFTGQAFEGLQGFGGNVKPSSGLRLWALQRLQHRFRVMGKQYPVFDSIDAVARQITSQQNRSYDLDVLRQAITVSFLHHKATNKLGPTAMGCVIGDGFASMTALLLASGSAGRVVLINLSKTLLVDLWYLKLWMGATAFESSVDLVTDEASLAQALAKPLKEGSKQVIALQASHHALLRSCPIDFAINIASMQEMDPPITAAYFHDLREVARKRELLFYCCNREMKQLPDGTVTEFLKYPWHTHDHILTDELCPWHKQYYTIRPPFYHSYDGAHQHRLAIFQNNNLTSSHE